MTIHPDIHTNAEKCATCMVRQSGTCGAMGADARNRFAHFSSLETLTRGEVIRVPGVGRSAGNVRKGVLKFARVEADGREHISQLLFPGDLFCLDSRSEGDFILSAATAAEVCIADGVDFLALVGESSDAGHAVLEAVAHELEDIEDWIVRMGTAQVGERIARFLLALRGRSPEMAPAVAAVDARLGSLGEFGDLPDDPFVVELPISRRDIAAFLGTSVESLSRQLQHFARIGVIRILGSRRFLIRAPHRLAQIARG